MTYAAVGLGQSQSERRDLARQLYSQGQAAYDSENYSLALSKFEQAYQTFSLPPVLIAMAESHLRLGQLAQARERAQRYLYADPGGSHASRARQIIDAASGKLATPTAPDVPASVPEGPAAPLPSVDDAYAQRSSIAVWVVTGVGILGLIGAGYYLSRPKRQTANRRRRTSRRR